MIELKRIKDNPELEIDRVFSDMRNKIDLTREEAKTKIDVQALELIKELNEYELKCKSELSANPIQLNPEIELLMNELKEEIQSWKKDLQDFTRNVKRLKTIHQDSVVKFEQLKQECERLRKSLFSDEFDKLETKQKKYCKKFANLDIENSFNSNFQRIFSDEKTDPLLYVFLLFEFFPFFQI